MSEDMPERTENDILFEIMPDSPTFKAIIELARKRHRAAMHNLRTVGLEQPQTEAQRGRIAELEWLLGLNQAVDRLPPKTPRAKV